MISENQQKALAWLEGVVSQALTEAQQGDAGLLNRLGFYPGAQYYINNVHGRPQAVLEQWLHWYPQHMREIERLYESYERERQLTAQAEKIASLEEKLSYLAEQLRTLLEAKTTETPKAAGRKRKASLAEANGQETAQPAPVADEPESAEQGPEKQDASADQAEEDTEAEES
jgi:hypothetical protein